MIKWRKKYKEPAPTQGLKCIVVIDKPKGFFSFKITQKVKEALKAKKAGHAGTLDPNATGVLPVAINKGCNVLRAISKAPKAYEAVMHLHSDVPSKLIHKTSKLFIGKIKQIPPVRSAVKRELREREIYEIKIHKIVNKDVFFYVKCEAGTYIRKLCVDWAKEMGINAHLKDLRRVLAGPFTIKDAVEFNNFLKDPQKYLRPIEDAVSHLKHVWVDNTTAQKIKNGAQPFFPGIYKYEEGIQKGELIAIMNPQNNLVALATSLVDNYELQKGQFAKLERVIL